MYHLQVVIMACVALRLPAFLALDVFRLVFITCFTLIYFITFLFVSRVSLLGFLSLYSAYPFQAGLFMVFSAPNLVFVVCVTFCLVFGIFCSYLFSMSLLPFGIVFHGVLLLLSSCAARHFGLVFHIFYTLRSVFFLYACSFAYPVVCRVFCSRSLLLTFSFPQLVPVFGNFLLYFFVCSSVL